MLCAVVGAVAKITINRERRRNALDHTAVAMLSELFERLEAADVTAIVLTGQGTTRLLRRGRHQGVQGARHSDLARAFSPRARPDGPDRRPLMSRDCCCRGLLRGRRTGTCSGLRLPHRGARRHFLSPRGPKDGRQPDLGRSHAPAAAHWPWPGEAPRPAGRGLDRAGRRLPKGLSTT